MHLGGQEIALIVIVVLLLFGAKRVPEVFRSLGQGIAEFKRASREVLHELDQEHPSSSSQRQSLPPAEGEERTANSAQGAPGGDGRTDK